MSALLAWAIEALIASAVLIAIVLAVRLPVRRQFGPQVAYALWALPVLRLLLPPLPQSWQQVAATPITRASETISMIIVPANTPFVAAAPVSSVTVGPSIAMIVTGLWAVGRGGVPRLAFGAAHPLLPPHRRERRRGFGVSRGCVSSKARKWPGRWRSGSCGPCVAFPRDFAERYDADERALALAHELGHHARGDLVANWIALVVLALHWFNPIAWRAFHLFSRRSGVGERCAGACRAQSVRAPCLCLRDREGGAWRRAVGGVPPPFDPGSQGEIVDVAKPDLAPTDRHGRRYRRRADDRVARRDCLGHEGRRADAFTGGGMRRESISPRCRLPRPSRRWLRRRSRCTR